MHLDSDQQVPDAKNDLEKGQESTKKKVKDPMGIARRLCQSIWVQDGNAVKAILDKHDDSTIAQVVFDINVDKIKRPKDKKLKIEKKETDKQEIVKPDKKPETKYIYVFDTPLNYALTTGNEQIFQHFIGKEIIKAEILKYSEKPRNRFAPIHAAAQNPHSKVLKLFTQDKLGNIYQTTNAGNTALHYACYKGHKENVDLLLDKGAKFDICNKSSEYPVHWAAARGDVKIFDTIFEKYAAPGLEKHKNDLDKAEKDILKEIEMQEKIGKKKMDKDEIDVKQKARERVEKSLNKKFGEECLKKEAVELGVPLLFAAKEHQYDCIGAILDHQMESDGTVRDHHCDTTLHFISDDINKKKYVKHFSKILKANALLGVKNLAGNTPLDRIEYDTMKAILDEHINKIVFPPTTINVSEKDKYGILITNPFGHHAKGADVLNIQALAQSKTHHKLIVHPLCQSILSAKWQKIKKYYLIKLLLFIPFVLLLSIYPIVLQDRKRLPYNETKIIERMDQEISIIWHALNFLFLGQVIFGTMSIIVLIKPLWKETKIYMAHWNTTRLMRLAEYYYRQLIWSDWYECILWVMASLLLHDRISPVPVVLVSWFVLFLVCSNHPSILPFRYMLIKILFRYIKFLIFAFGLISGFAMGFFLALRDCKTDDGTPCVNGAFTSIYTTALKIPSMMMGELDFEGFSLDLEASPQVYILFGAFIFLITMCLFNMMNGLAINITREMMQKAHIFKIIAQCDMIYEFEIMLTEITAWLKWFGFKEVNFLAPLWVESLKVSPNTGKCYNLDEYNESKHGKEIQEIKNAAVAKWIWVDRGYVLDSKILCDLILHLEQKERNQSDDNLVSSAIYKDPVEEGSSSENDQNGDSDSELEFIKQDNMLEKRKPSVVLMDEKKSLPDNQKFKTQSTPVHEKEPQGSGTSQKSQSTPVHEEEPESAETSQKSQPTLVHKEVLESKDKDTSQETDKLIP